MQWMDRGHAKRIVRRHADRLTSRVMRRHCEDGAQPIAALSGDHPVRAALREAGPYALFDLRADPSSALDTLI